MCMTEVDSGKFHSTMPLWGYIAVKHLGLPGYANLADLYVRLGMGEEVREPHPRRPTSSPRGTTCSGTWTSGPTSGGRTAGRRRCSDGRRPPKAYVFDMDGTLGTIPVDWDGVREGLREVTGDPSEFRPIFPTIGAVVAKNPKLARAVITGDRQVRGRGGSFGPPL